MGLDTVIIDTRPGGYTVAIRIAEMGQKVAITEREYIGNACLNVDCIPSKTLIAARHHYQELLDSEMFGATSENVKLDFAKAQEWKENRVVHMLTSGAGLLLRKHRVEIIEGEVPFVDDHTPRVIHPDSAQTYSFNNAVIAIGSRPIEILGFRFGGRILDSTGGLALKEVPKKLAIIGGSVIGAKLGKACANLGAEVAILEGLPRILPIYEKDLVKLIEDGFKKRSVTIVTNVMAKKAADSSDSATMKYAMDREEESVTADCVMATVGHRPNTNDMGLEQAGVEAGERRLITVDKQGRTNVPNIYAIGDIVPGVVLAHKASYEIKIAAKAISGEKVAVGYRAMPTIAFTDPELASVGMTIEEAEDADIEAKAYKFPFSGNGWALSLGKTERSTHLIATIEDNVLTNAQIGGIGANDMVFELVLAIESGMNAEDIVLTIHPHPSLDEIVADASELALGLPIHI